MTELTLILPPSSIDSKKSARVGDDPVAALRQAGFTVPPGTVIHVEVEEPGSSDRCTTDDLFHTVGG